MCIWCYLPDSALGILEGITGGRMLDVLSVPARMDILQNSKCLNPKCRQLQDPDENGFCSFGCEHEWEQTLEHIMMAS